MGGGHGPLVGNNGVYSVRGDTQMMGKMYWGSGTAVEKIMSRPGGEPFEELLEPDRIGDMPVGVTVQSCFVRVKEVRFPVVVCNESTEDVVIPKSMHLATLYNAAVVRDYFFLIPRPGFWFY